MGIAFSLAEVSLASGWGGDRAVLGIWSGRWFRVPEALQAQKIKYKQEEGDPRAGNVVRWSRIHGFVLAFPSLLRYVSGSRARGQSLDVCSVNRPWALSRGIPCLTKVLTPVQNEFKTLPHQIRWALHASGKEVVKTHSAKASGNFTILEHLHFCCMQKCLLAWKLGPATVSSLQDTRARGNVREASQEARITLEGWFFFFNCKQGPVGCSSTLWTRPGLEKCESCYEKEET